ncbi:Prolyl oligopeptidase family [Musa troglodytarum]|uniref:Prolyl oligopeptidase family n=1 Tax=Musa troglodytarum TaxID=320322 RepID=A0A9E7HNA4_9LILI|nr:Prolyl oligopeptidase family [Musa troglodytarum]
MVSFLKAVVYGAGGLVVVGMVALVTFQERLVYVPVLPGLARAYPITPARLRLDYEDVFLRAADGVRLHAWFVKHSPPKPVNVVNEEGFSWIGAHTFVCFSRYGESDGHPSQHGIIMDAQAALDHLTRRKDIDTSRIVVFGRSLGGAVGAMLARNNSDKVSALILENTFTSILDMAAIMFPFLKWFIGGSGSKSPKIEQPILFLSGLQDELVPPSHMQMLYAKAIENNRDCRFVDFPNGTHMDTWFNGGERYWRTIQLFLDHYIPEIKECILNCEVDDKDDAAG